MTISKTKAFTAHLAISVLIFAVLSWFLLFRWFPGELFFIDGGWQGMRIIAAVDLVLGPMLTLIFYKPGKPKVVFDLAIIAVVQTCALTYGVWSAHQQSTVALAFVEGRFVTVAHSALVAGDTEMRADGKPTQSLDAFDQHRPVQVFVEPPPPDEYGQYLADVLNGKSELHERSHRFRALGEHLGDINAYKQTLPLLEQQNPVLHDVFVEHLWESGFNADEIDIYKLKARYGVGLVIVPHASQSIEDIFVIEESVQ
ncbi:MAG: hypothetical protein AAF434_14320 [Pseudomonadota bacterium]